VERYFCFSKRFSRPISCSSVNTVRLRRPFLAACRLLPSAGEPRSSSLLRWCCCWWWGWWPEEPPSCRPPGSSGEPCRRGPCWRAQDSGDRGNLRRLAACSAFSTAGWRKEKCVQRLQGFFSGVYKSTNQQIILNDHVGVI